MTTGEADEAALDEMYGKGHADGYADAMLEASSDRHVTAVARVRVALYDILDIPVMVSDEENTALKVKKELAQILLATISDALEGRP